MEWRGGEGRGGQGRVPDCLGGLSRVGISSRSKRPWNGQPPSYITIVDDNRFTLTCMDIRIATGNSYVQYYTGTSRLNYKTSTTTTFAFWLPPPHNFLLPHNKHKQLPMHRLGTADAGSGKQDRCPRSLLNSITDPPWNSWHAIDQGPRL